MGNCHKPPIPAGAKWILSLYTRPAQKRPEEQKKPKAKQQPLLSRLFIVRHGIHDNLLHPHVMHIAKSSAKLAQDALRRHKRLGGVHVCCFLWAASLQIGDSQCFSFKKMWVLLKMRGSLLVLDPPSEFHWPNILAHTPSWWNWGLGGQGFCAKYNKLAHEGLFGCLCFQLSSQRPADLGLVGSSEKGTACKGSWSHLGFTTVTS